MASQFQAPAMLFVKPNLELQHLIDYLVFHGVFTAYGFPTFSYCNVTFYDVLKNMSVILRLQAF